MSGLSKLVCLSLCALLAACAGTPSRQRSLSHRGDEAAAWRAQREGAVGLADYVAQQRQSILLLGQAVQPAARLSEH